MKRQRFSIRLHRHIVSFFPNSEATEKLPVPPITAKYKRRPAERVTPSEQVFNSAHHIFSRDRIQQSKSSQTGFQR